MRQRLDDSISDDLVPELIDSLGGKPRTPRVYYSMGAVTSLMVAALNPELRACGFALIELTFVPSAGMRSSRICCTRFGICNGMPELSPLTAPNARRDTLSRR